ncbi:hypothetical protein QPK87_26130 [Kamptonema cortianum]|nr:hypothetical protein [Geitlerinema splendidum]MDK3160014.1 hypothetical protein [Kamptonema cortianum]
MKLKILTATLCMSVIGYSEVSLAATTSRKSTNYNCQEIYAHYISAVNQFLDVVNTLSTDRSFDKTNLKEQLSNAIYTLNKKYDYSHPTLVTLYKEIKKSNEELPSNNQADLSELESQMKSAGKQVTDWQANNTSSCRTNNHNADLGQLGTVAAVGCNLVTQPPTNSACPPN